MGNFYEDAKDLMEAKVPLELSNKIAIAEIAGVTFSVGKGGGHIYGKVSQDAVGLGWIYIDIGGSKGSGGHVKIDYADVKKWTWSDKHKELRFELK